MSPEETLCVKETLLTDFKGRVCPRPSPAWDVRVLFILLSKCSKSLFLFTHLTEYSVERGPVFIYLFTGMDGVINAYDIAVLLWSQFERPPYNDIPDLKTMKTVDTRETMMDMCCSGLGIKTDLGGARGRASTGRRSLDQSTALA